MDLKSTHGDRVGQEKGTMGSQYQVWRSPNAKPMILDFCGKKQGCEVVVWPESSGMAVITKSKCGVQCKQG